VWYVCVLGFSFVQALSSVWPMISIDPGNSCGYAIWSEQPSVHLSGCDIMGPDKVMAGVWRRVVCEKPFVYPHSRVDPNNLITLAITAGILTERLVSIDGEVVWVLPRQWKGQIPKTKKLDDYVIYRRLINGVLDKNEAVIFAHALLGKSLKEQLDIVDAVGIGAHDLGRL
jgi:hypothetical protein